MPGAGFIDETYPHQGYVLIFVNEIESETDMQLIIMRQDSGNHSRGDVVEVRASGTSFAPTANFVMVGVPEATLKDWEQYSGAWERMLAFDIVAHNESLDGYRLRLYSETANAGNGIIMKAEVENHIAAWNGTIQSFGTNEVVFDIGIFDALRSAAFFEVNISAVVFTEIAYDSVTGIHRISADYSAIGNNPTYVERYLMREGMEVISHADKVIIYEADRQIAKARFERYLQEKARQSIERRRYYLSEGVVTAIETAGGTLETDISTITSYLKDKAVD
jgi:hypothetical protein